MGAWKEVGGPKRNFQSREMVFSSENGKEIVKSLAIQDGTLLPLPPNKTNPGVNCASALPPPQITHISLAVHAISDRIQKRDERKLGVDETWRSSNFGE